MSATPAAVGRPVVAVAFAPSAPLLIPAVAGRSAVETAALRSACLEAVAAMLASQPETVVVVGAGADRERFGAGDRGDLRGFGVDLQVPFSGKARPGGRRLPLAHTIGAWLLEEAAHAGRRLGVGPGDLAEVLAGLPSSEVGVLAVGDGSARRSIKAPGHLDPAAGPFDAAVAAALGDGDAAALAAIDPLEGQRLLADGVPTWRAVGSAVAGRDVAARLLFDDAPFGVGYLVAEWRCR